MHMTISELWEKGYIVMKLSLLEGARRMQPGSEGGPGWAVLEEMEKAGT